jgi:hypothetical protein
MSDVIESSRESDIKEGEKEIRFLCVLMGPYMSLGPLTCDNEQGKVIGGGRLQEHGKYLQWSLLNAWLVVA